MEKSIMALPLRKDAHKLPAHPVLQVMESFQYGGLAVTFPDGRRVSYNSHAPGTQADMCINDGKALDYIASHGDIGLGIGYVTGLWDTPDLKSFMRLMAENIDAIEKYLYGRNLYRILFSLKNRLRANTYNGSRENIHTHYDLGNDFYKLWLDKTLTYSCALFNGDESLSLEGAQKAKYRRILGMLAPKSSDHILEIGCGWGGFMEEAARSGCRVTGITISSEQAELAQERLQNNNLDRLTNVLLEDYRDIQGQYDHIVSIGMMEHVGEAFWPVYLKKIYNALKPAGRAMIQCITIRDDLFESYRKSSDFMREYIFPGGMLPSVSRFKTEAQKAGFSIEDTFHFGRDYAITLEKWHGNFDSHLLDISSLGYSEEFIRKWRLYLTSSAAMFRAGRISVMQALVSRA